MIYRKLGNTGVEVSAIGCGGTRFQYLNINGKKIIDEENTCRIYEKAFELGINYYDTAWNYGSVSENLAGDGERILGEGIKAFREKVYIATKIPVFMVEKQSEYRKYLEHSLKQLDTDYIDFYFFHALAGDNIDKLERLKLYEEAIKAKSEGLIRNICFSTHQGNDFILDAINRYEFSSILSIYNLLNRNSEKVIEIAAGKGIGTLAMGPNIGGLINSADKSFIDKFEMGIKRPTELSTKFVLSNKNLNCALLGMTSVEMLEENVNVANQDVTHLHDTFQRSLESIENKSDIDCNSCDYCMTCCPIKIIPAAVFRAYNRNRIWGLVESPKNSYKGFGVNPGASNNPEKCSACGTCMVICPQKLNIPKNLKTAALALSRL